MKTKVLVIDDEQALCELLKINLERIGEYEVTTACSGAEGLEKATATAFDVVITDFKMPGMTGEEVLQALKARNPQIPVLFFSIYQDDATTLTQTAQRQVDGVITKPIERAQLHRAIQEALHRRTDGG